VWARAGVLAKHISPPRRLLLSLLSSAAAPPAADGDGSLLEVVHALGLDWTRSFGLWLW
jgi:hypothetical protein